MNLGKLSEAWKIPDRQAVRPLSLRVPLHVFSRLRALQGLYPDRTLTELVSDILSSALDDIEEYLTKWSEDSYKEIDPDIRRELYEDHQEFLRRWNRWKDDAMKEVEGDKQQEKVEESV